MVIFAGSATYRLPQVNGAGFCLFDGCELIRTAI